MITYWKKDSPEAWDHFRKHNIVDADMRPVYPESVDFMKNFIERHGPVTEELLARWNKEADICGSSYGVSLRLDIKWARKCNERQDEVLIFSKTSDEAL